MVDGTQLEVNSHNQTLLEQLQTSINATTTTLPDYIAQPSRPPPYNPPTNLLSPSWLRQYLLLLAAFHQLKKSVLSLDLKNYHDASDCLKILDERERWGLFVEMAVRRFGIWQSKCIQQRIKDLPPLDVLMVWCAYLASPRWYNEDAIRLPSSHPRSIYPDFPLDDAAKAIDDTSPMCTYSPGSAAEANWKASTSMHFSPVESFHTSIQIPIECPRCDGVFSVPWLTNTCEGYAQRGFVAKCEACKLQVTKEAIGLRRLIDDIKNLIELNSSRLSSYLLAHTYRSLPPPHPLAKVMKTLDGTVRDIGSRWEWRREAAAVLDIASNSQDVDKSVKRLMSGYVGAEKASVDLVAATLRQSTFIEKLHILGWLEPSRWDSGAENLERAIIRYTRFLELAKEAPKRLLVPTLGIEIAWQTHLLLASRYVIDTQAFIGHLFDREDAIDEGLLSSAFDDTARRWQTRFKALYSTSGHLPPESKLSARLRLWPMSSPSCSANIDYNLPIIYTEEDSLLSYPAERSSIYVAMDEKATKSRHKRVTEFQDRLARELRNESKGLVDPGLVRRAEANRPAFLTGDVDWDRFGPTGYPVTANGIIATANVMDGRIILSRGAIGLGAVGAGLELCF